MHEHHRHTDGAKAPGHIGRRHSYIGEVDDLGSEGERAGGEAAGGAEPRLDRVSCKGSQGGLHQGAKLGQQGEGCAEDGGG